MTRRDDDEDEDDGVLALVMEERERKAGERREAMVLTPLAQQLFLLLFPLSLSCLCLPGVSPVLLLCCSRRR